MEKNYYKQKSYYRWNNTILPPPIAVFCVSNILLFVWRMMMLACFSVYKGFIFVLKFQSPQKKSYTYEHQRHQMETFLCRNCSEGDLSIVCM